MPDVGERIATLESTTRGLLDEMKRTRDRLHSAEATLQGVVLESRARDAETARRQRRIEIRVQVLTAVVGIAAVVTPLTITLAHSH